MKIETVDKIIKELEEMRMINIGIFQYNHAEAFDKSIAIVKRHAKLSAKSKRKDKAV